MATVGFLHHPCSLIADSKRAVMSSSFSAAAAGPGCVADGAAIGVIGRALCACVQRGRQRQ